MCHFFRVPPRWLFVRVETADGFVGWGESTLEGHTEAIEGAFGDLASRFVHWDADGIEDIWQAATRARFYRGGPVLMSALSGLDIALWDIKGKKLGVPIWQLLGGKVRDRLRVYGWIGGDHPNAVREAAAERKQQGFTAVKMNATEGVAWIDSYDVLKSTVERVREVRSLGMDVGVDFHGRLHKGMARQLAALLEKEGVLFIEGRSQTTEPLLPTFPSEFADLARSVSTPIATGERLYSRHDFRPFFEGRALDIAQPDVSHCGGISELVRIAAFAETYDVALAPHCPLGPIALAACVAVGVARLNCESFTPAHDQTCQHIVSVYIAVFIQEMSWQIHYNSEDADLYTYLEDPTVFTVQDGYIQAPSGERPCRRVCQ
ncbi:enolase C-terminal domain-like protein [Lanmaoa asiatica]|nr:enolase C-terminal domain-like protein [Lanmaoa asiatica]